MFSYMQKVFQHAFHKTRYLINTAIISVSMQAENLPHIWQIKLRGMQRYFQSASKKQTETRLRCAKQGGGLVEAFHNYTVIK